MHRLRTSLAVVLAKTGILAADLDRADARVSRCGVATKHRFNVIYTVRDNVTWIVAIAHPARRTRYWAERKLRR